MMGTPWSTLLFGVTIMSLAGMFALTAQKAEACSMICPGVEKLYGEAQRVFRGRVEDIEFLQNDTGNNEPNINVHVSIDKTWKGADGYLILNTVYNRFSCRGYAFKRKAEYVFLLDSQRSINFCNVMSMKRARANNATHIIENLSKQ